MFQRRSKTRPIQNEVVMEPAWPQDAPRLYPNLSDRELSEFFSEELYLEAMLFPRVMVWPFGSANRSVREQLLGMGLSRLLIRDLMLTRNLSIRGPEDCPDDFAPNPAQLPPGKFRADVVITGQVAIEDGLLVSAEMWLHHHQGHTVSVRVPAGNLPALVEGCRREIARVLNGHINKIVEDRWQTGRPSSFETLQEFGQLCLLKEDSGRGEQALSLWKREKEFVLPIHLISENEQGRRYWLRGLEYDPHDAQLCFLLFLSYWESRGPQPEAAQFLRRAISLSPGHGKAHMCAPHAADSGVDMLRHSELGYRLLPGNPFAINNYILYLKDAGETQTLKQLAVEGIQTDPHDHSSYERLIEIYEAEGDYPQALHYAHLLLELYEPTIHPRTYVCLQQNPARAARLADDWNPADDLKRVIHRLSQWAVGKTVEIVKLTKAAAKELGKSLWSMDESGSARIRVVAQENPHGEVRYRLDFDQEYDPQLDVAFVSLGVPLVVDRKQIQFLEGTVVDYHPRRGQFQFMNPNDPD